MWFCIFLLFFNGLFGSLVPLWSRRLPQAIDFSESLVVMSKVFVGCVDSKVYCLDFNTGEILWNFQTNQPVKDILNQSLSFFHLFF